MAGPGTGSVPDEYAFIGTGSRSRCTAGEPAELSTIRPPSARLKGP